MKKFLEKKIVLILYEPVTFEKWQLKKTKNMSEYIQKLFIIEAEECKCTFLENFGVSLFVSITKSKYTYVHTYMLAHNPLSR